MGLRPLIFFLIFQCGDRLYTSESDVYRRQILTYEDGPRTERVKYITLPLESKYTSKFNTQRLYPMYAACKLDAECRNGFEPSHLGLGHCV